MRAHFTPQAEIDLEEVGDYIALDNPERAVSFIREIRQHCEKIAGGPDHYAARPDLGDTIRICGHGNYLIVFEPFDDGALLGGTRTYYVRRFDQPKAPRNATPNRVAKASRFSLAAYRPPRSPSLEIALSRSVQ